MHRGSKSVSIHNTSNWQYGTKRDLKGFASKGNFVTSLQGLQLFGEEQMTESDWYAVEQAEQDAQQDRLVVLADIWLDKPDTLDRLHTVFAGI